MALSSVLTAPQRLAFRHNRIFVRAVPGMAEQLIHGPYIEVPEGQYSVYWRVELTGQPGFLRVCPGTFLFLTELSEHEANGCQPQEC